ncbi:MAG: 16S rRNA (adenine(1518)-N(6)/adenine(1519)-N(6))-dimethyltransferase RsmA [Candidatus Sumerlaeia bacterium]|nr:16S rRNA (adenine(1518)-N(6)/adenine(1519)-N(6))-dimethyltransferase RsmA [Candidatus Sumerlaeia bacterium]
MPGEFDIHLPPPRQLAAEFGLVQRRGLGQCFLDHHRTLDRLVRLGGVEPETAVIEVGAGPGYLTARIVRRTPHVWALEIDTRMKPIHERYFGGPPNVAPPVRFLYGDALRADWPALLAEIGDRPYVVMGNIPYQITSPLIDLLLHLRPLPLRCVLLVQCEFAQRLAAQPGRKAYGALTVKTALVAAVRQGLFVPRRMFQPRPRVDAAAVVIEPRRPPLVDAESLPGVFSLVEACFTQRRKKIINSILDSKRFGDDRNAVAALLNQAGIDPVRRAETLTVGEFIRLWDAAAAHAEQSPAIPHTASTECPESGRA